MPALEDFDITKEAWTKGSPSGPPGNTASLVAGGFASALQMSDIRFELSVYGNFFHDIPRRLGLNEALDASVAAMTIAFEAIYTRHQPAEVFIKYGKALRALRACLSDPNKAKSPETLCAIWIVLICQVSRGQSLVVLLHAILTRSHSLSRDGLETTKTIARAMGRQSRTC